MINVCIYTMTMAYAKNGKQSATDYAIFQSSLLLSEIIAASLSMTIAEYVNYLMAFLLALLSIIAIKLTYKHISI